MKPIIRRVETKTGHYYLDQRDQRIPGVTTVLKCLPKEALDAWKLRKAVALALEGEAKWGLKPGGMNLVDWLIAAGDREANKAANVGTNAHEFAELHMTGQNPVFEDLGKKEQKHAACYLQFTRDFQPEPVLVEKVLTYIDPKTGYPLYAGTMDLVAKLTASDDALARVPNDWVDGQTWLCDYKASSSKPRPSHAIQSAAYRYATHWLEPETGELHEMVPVDKTAVILLNGGGAGHCYRLIELDSSPVVFSVFKSLLRIHNFSKVEERVILREM